jgi:flagellar protein FliO/FliZ
MRRAVAVVYSSALVAQPAFAAPGVAMADLTGVVLSLALVVGFIFAAAWVVRRMPMGFTRASGPLKVLAALPLGPKERLVLVEARGEELLIAVSPAGVFNVGGRSARPLAAPLAPPAAAPTFVMPDPS